MIDQLRFIGVEYKIEKRDKSRDADTAEESIQSHRNQTGEDIWPIAKHHPVEQDQISASFSAVFFLIHNVPIKKASKCWQGKKWHALRDSNP